MLMMGREEEADVREKWLPQQTNNSIRGNCRDNKSTDFSKKSTEKATKKQRKSNRKSNEMIEMANKKIIYLKKRICLYKWHSFHL